MEQLSPEKIAQIKDVLKEMDVTSANHSLIQENKILFPFNDKMYCCRMPNQREQTLAEQAQNRLKIKLVQEKGNIGKKQLIKDLKENQNIDIEELERKKDDLRKELQDSYLDLAIVNSEDIDKIEDLREKKQTIEEKFMEITIEIIEWISPCIQEQAKAQYYKYLAYICTDTQVEQDKFESTWKNYEEFEEDTTGLSYKAIEHLQSLLLNIKE